MATRILTYALLLISAAVALIPFVFLVCAAFKTTPDVYAHHFLPSGDGLFGIAWDRLTFNNVTRLFTDNDLSQSIVNSVLLASVTSVFAVLVSSMGGYALAKFKFRGRELLTNLVLGMLVAPVVLFLAPTYQLLYWFGLLDTYTGMILPAIAPAFGIFLFRQAVISSVPDEILDASRIDGCGEIRIFVSIVLPLLRPMIGAFLLIVFLGTWNNFVWPQVVLQSPDKFPLAVAIAQLRGVYAQDYALVLAGTLISIAPVIVLFLLLQKDFIAGLTSGAVKG